MFINSKFILGVLMFCGGAQALTENTGLSRRHIPHQQQQAYYLNPYGELRTFQSAPNARGGMLWDQNPGMQERPVTLKGISYSRPAWMANP
jgi:hypothetical protein